MASPFASLTVSESISLPFDSGQWIQVRALNGREFQEAQEAHRWQVATGRMNTWSETFRTALKHGADDPSVFKALADPLTGFDRHVLARRGLVAWSYTQPIKPVQAQEAKDGQPAVEAYDAISDLKDEAIDFIAREVLRRTKPQLFEVSQGLEADQKKG